MIRQATFYSVWDDGNTVIETPALVDDLTGKITTEPVAVDGLDLLDRQYVVYCDDTEETEHPVCVCCDLLENFCLGEDLE